MYFSDSDSSEEFLCPNCLKSKLNQASMSQELDQDQVHSEEDSLTESTESAEEVTPADLGYTLKRSTPMSPSTCKSISLTAPALLENSGQEKAKTFLNSPETPQSMEE
ncbi:MAG: hypothetical protein [Cressdnaviricota sp.]|nr:MAG: hypothetical protein [Cressdnaviricota sp.]